ncbi:gliding motility-associated C-terminal domain-containing protein [Flavobacterium sp.]|uniref:gliding motility-associated C-terminal domain-containing protein n=1 Tax=Flavobacterium sp. TaxID=239 RepID=UPI003BBB15CA
MNLGENNVTVGCENIVVTSSSTSLNLNSDFIIQNAYLYWAGSGLGDFNVQLNSVPISAQRTFSNISISSGLPYFSAFADVTSQIISTGNGSYSLSDLDVSQTLINESGYCDNRTNFAGWAMIIVYKGTTLPLNQINIYDGLESIPNAITINLNNLNVVDANNAQIGFIAWEGDANLSVNETLSINGNTLSNPPLNPANNAFNGTYSITGSNTLYNMDLDIYNIQNNIAVGDTSAQIQLTSSRDVVFINAVVTKLNSQLPDASVVLNSNIQNCNSKSIALNFNINNFNCTQELPAATPIAIYANGQLVAQTQTTSTIPIDGSETLQITINLPIEIIDNFTISIVVDDNGSGLGTVSEISENNNQATSPLLSLWATPTFNTLPPQMTCNQGLTKGTFNFFEYSNLAISNVTDTFAGFYETVEDASSATNTILNPTNYTANTTPKEIFIRIENQHCFAITSFLLQTKICPPTFNNYVSNNNDGENDSFSIEGLRDIFMNFELEIYNRWGKLIWTGNNNSPDWDGIATNGFRLDNLNVPEGTYYYILKLNDNDYPDPLTGWLYYTK